MNNKESDRINDMIEQMQRVFVVEKKNGKDWINLTAMLKVAGKRGDNFAKRREKFIEGYLGRRPHLKRSDVIYGGTGAMPFYINVEIATGLATLIDSGFHEAVTEIVNAYMKGDLTTEGSKYAEERMGLTFPTLKEEKEFLQKTAALELMGKLNGPTKEMEKLAIVAQKITDLGDWRLNGKLQAILDPEIAKLNAMFPTSDSNKLTFGEQLAYNEWMKYGVSAEEHARHDAFMDRSARILARQRAKGKKKKRYRYEDCMYSVETDELIKRDPPTNTKIIIPPHVQACFDREARERDLKALNEACARNEV
jgi:hypothetical protein